MENAIKLDPVDLTDFDIKAMKTRGTFKLSADMSILDVKTAALIFAHCGEGRENRILRIKEWEIVEMADEGLA